MKDRIPPCVGFGSVAGQVLNVDDNTIRAATYIERCANEINCLDAAIDRLAGTVDRVRGEPSDPSCDPETHFNSPLHALATIPEIIARLTKQANVINERLDELNQFREPDRQRRRHRHARDLF